MDTVLPILRGCVKTRHTADVTRARHAEGAAPARRSPGRPPIPLDRIVATALNIIDEDGADALSMRSLAQRLGSGTATLYRHFANRAELIAHVVDHLVGDVEVDGAKLAAMSWQQACLTEAHAMFDALRRHKNIAPLLVEHVPVGPNALARRERLIAVLLDNGFPVQLAARAHATLARYVLGFGIQFTGHSVAGDLDEAQLSEVFHGLDPSRFPATVAVADALPVPLEVEFAFGLELILDGLTQVVGRD
jgi:TetR/AcrR family transcriptional regulator, tetracycline repressor protein